MLPSSSGVIQVPALLAVSAVSQKHFTCSGWNSFVLLKGLCTKLGSNLREVWIWEKQLQVNLPTELKLQGNWGEE